jgi:hypothetical protein
MGKPAEREPEEAAAVPPAVNPDGQSGRPAPDGRRGLHGLRALGPLVAWVGAVASGWKVAQQVDLLEAVLRGAGAWLGILVVWIGGVSVCDRILHPAPPTSHRSEELSNADGTT